MVSRSQVIASVTSRRQQLMRHVIHIADSKLDIIILASGRSRRSVLQRRRTSCCQP